MTFYNPNPANAQIHNYFLPPRSAPASIDGSPQHLDSTPLRPPESGIVRKYVYFCPPTPARRIERLALPDGPAMV